ncbi:MAG TPA: YhjD/YihY/BrkB family envelope integrity protein [Syntrophales bacterium]|nr:YhjD/YihY/BrkB family envelope integrity protein [Syntrophales bacterium]
MTDKDTHRKSFQPRQRECPLFIAPALDILRDAVENFRRNGDTNQAAAIAFYAILSIIPLYILTLLAAGLVFGGSQVETQERLLRLIQEFHPYFSEKLVSQFGQAEQISQKSKVLGWVGVISLIWFSAMVFNALETALDIIFRSKKGRNYFLSKLLAIAMIPAGWVVGIVSVTITYVSTIVAKHPLVMEGGLFAVVTVHNLLFRYVVPYLILVFFSAFVYKVIPTGQVKLSSAVAGGALFSAMMEAAKHLFTWYVENYTRYDVVYGSLGTVVVVVIWIFYVAFMLLFCAELISSYQRRDLILLEKAFVEEKRRKSVNTDERLFKKFGKIYPRGSYIFQEGDADGEMFYILSGCVHVEKRVGQGQKLLAELGPGSYFGEMSPLLEEPRTASVRAFEDSSIAVITKDNFRNLIRESVDVSLVMLQEFSRRVRNTNEKLERLAEAWSRMVIVFYFLKEWPIDSGRDPVAELAGLTGKERPEIQELLQNMAKQGIFSLEKDRVVDFNRSRAWELSLKD